MSDNDRKEKFQDNDNTENADERLKAFEGLVSRADSRLKSAEMTLKDIEDQIKVDQDYFMGGVSDKALEIKEQTGADFERIIDVTGDAKFIFSRETTDCERRKQRKTILRRHFDETTGKVSYRAVHTDENTDLFKNITDVKDFKRPKERTKFIAMPTLRGYRKLDLSTQANPFLRTIGSPIVLPIQVAERLTNAIKERATPIAKVVATPIIIPTRIIKDISDKGGIIHAIVDKGDRFVIEGVNLPKPIKTIGNVAKNTALGVETLGIETVKGVEKFSIDIAKEQVYQEIHKAVYDNTASESAYVVGMKAVAVYSILREHDRYRRAVTRAMLGDVTDINVFNYLSQKDESNFRNYSECWQAKKEKAVHDVKLARAEYDKAHERMKNYKNNISDTNNNERTNSVSKPPKKVKNDLPNDTSIPLSKTDKQIEKLKSQIVANQRHTYKIRRTAVFDENAKHGKGAIKHKVALTSEVVTGKPVANLKNTIDNLGTYAVTDNMRNLRRKAMQDGGDNSGVQAANLGITGLQKGHQFLVATDEWQRRRTDERLRSAISNLENGRNINLCEKPNNVLNDSTSKSNKQTKKQQNKASQKKSIKKKHQQNVFKQKKKATSKKLLSDVKNFLFRRAKSMGFLVILIIAVLLIPTALLPLLFSSGSSSVSILDGLMSPSETIDLTKCGLYYDELGRNMIDMHQNIDYYYQNYNKYVCLTEINQIDDMSNKMLPYLAVKALSDSGSTEWSYDEVTDDIEYLFNLQYELYTNEIDEIRKNVSTITYSEESSYWSIQGTAQYDLTMPTNVTFDIDWLNSYSANNPPSTYEEYEVVVATGTIMNMLENVGVLSDAETGAIITEYDKAEMVQFTNIWEIKLHYKFNYYTNQYEEYWIYTEKRQDYYEYDYYVLEYAIIENDIEVADEYFSESDWEDSNQDKIIYNLLNELGDDEKSAFGNYYSVNMGHQELKLPYSPVEVITMFGYNNLITGNNPQVNYMEIKASQGLDVLSAMNGVLIDKGTNSFSLYNKSFGTIHYQFVTPIEADKVSREDVCGTATGNRIRITFIDEDGNYHNPYFLFSYY